MSRTSVPPMRTAPAQPRQFRLDHCRNLGLGDTLRRLPLCEANPQVRQLCPDYAARVMETVRVACRAFAIRSRTVITCHGAARRPGEADLGAVAVAPSAGASGIGRSSASRPTGGWLAACVPWCRMCHSLLPPGDWPAHVVADAWQVGAALVACAGDRFLPARLAAPGVPAIRADP